jgi:hypothetical protein
LSKRISKLLTTTIAKNEFSNTFVTKHLAPHQDSEQLSESGGQESKKEETKDDVIVDDESNSSSVVLSKQKIVLNKDTGVKRKSRIAIISGS